MRLKKNNKGFSLVEMMVAVAILSIVMVAIGWILSSMSKSFGNSQREVQLQDSVQTTYSIVSDIVKEAQSVKTGITNKCESVVIDGDRVYVLVEQVDQANSGLELKLPTTTALFYIFDFDSANHKLYLYNGSYNPYDILDGAGGAYTFSPTKFETVIKSVSSSAIRTPGNLLSNNVEKFEVVDKLDSGYVIVQLELKYGSREASIVQNVYLRNSNVYSDGLQEITPETTITVTAAATPTPTPTPAVSGGLSIVNAGEFNAPEKETISAHDSISVRYDNSGLYELDYNNLVQMYDYKYVCKHCGSELGLNWDGSKFTHYWCGVTNTGYGEIDPTHEIVQENATPIGDPQPAKNYLDCEGILYITNESLSQGYNNVEIVIYFEDSNSGFVPVDEASYLKVNTEANGNGVCNVYYGKLMETGGKYRYLKITIPYIKPAETYTENGEEKIKYDSYVFNYKWDTSSGTNPVVCAYSITGN